MLGPDEDGTLFGQLAQSASRALTPTGSLLVTSDVGTFSAAREMCINAGVPHSVIQGINQPKGDSVEVIVPDILIIPQASCADIKAKGFIRQRRDNPFMRSSLYDSDYLTRLSGGINMDKFKDLR